MTKFKITFYAAGQYLNTEIEAKNFEEAFQVTRELGQALFKIEWTITSISL